MPILVRDGGVWKESSPSVKDAGVWKTANEGHVKDAGVWKQFHSNRQLIASGSWETGSEGWLYRGGNLPRSTGSARTGSYKATISHDYQEAYYALPRSVLNSFPQNNIYFSAYFRRNGGTSAAAIMLFDSSQTQYKELGVNTVYLKIDLVFPKPPSGDSAISIMCYRNGAASVFVDDWEIWGV